MKLFDKTIKRKGIFFISLQNCEQNDDSSFNSLIGTTEADSADIVIFLCSVGLADFSSSALFYSSFILSCSEAIRFKSKYFDGMKMSPNKLGARRMLWI